MTEKSTDDRGARVRSSKGEWYLRLLGIESEDAPTSLQEVVVSPDVTKTTGIVSDMWEQTSELAPVDVADDPFADWQPTELSTTIASRRRVRWPVVVIAVVIGAVASFLLWWMPQVSDQRAANHAELMSMSLNAVYADLAEVQQALSVATEPGSNIDDLGAIASALAGIGDSSGRLLDVANQDVPSPLPLSAIEPFDDLAAARSGLERLAAEATSIRDEVADIADYRIALSRILVVDELPATADSATITEQGAILARALADSVAALTLMPTDGPFAEHRALVEATISTFAQWQSDYLNALRNADLAKTERLIADLENLHQTVSDDVVTPLATLRGELDGRILILADRLSNAVAMLP